MLYHRRFRVAAPLSEVARFHQSAESLEAITPPFVPMRFTEKPAGTLGDGDTMTFVMWVGPIPVRWRARLEQFTEHSFVDRQVEGPFGSWVHRHSFEADGDEAAWVDDRIEAKLPRNPFRALIALSMWGGLPVLFRYRAWKTRKLLEG